MAKELNRDLLMALEECFWLLGRLGGNSVREYKSPIRLGDDAPTHDDVRNTWIMARSAISKATDQ